MWRLFEQRKHTLRKGKMKYAIEYGGSGAFFDGQYVRSYNKYTSGIGYVPTSETIMICGWCDKNHHLTKRLKELGYETSHGICEQCSEKFFAYKPKE